jgi:hypothetical protein
MTILAEGSASRRTKHLDIVFGRRRYIVQIDR